MCGGGRGAVNVNVVRWMMMLNILSPVAVTLSKCIDKIVKLMPFLYHFYQYEEEAMLFFSAIYDKKKMMN